MRLAVHSGSRSNKRALRVTGELPSGHFLPARLRIHSPALPVRNPTICGSLAHQRHPGTISESSGLTKTTIPPAGDNCQYVSASSDALLGFLERFDDTVAPAVELGIFHAALRMVENIFKSDPDSLVERNRCFHVRREALDLAVVEND